MRRNLFTEIQVESADSSTPVTNTPAKKTPNCLKSCNSAISGIRILERYKVPTSSSIAIIAATKP